MDLDGEELILLYHIFMGSIGREYQLQDHGAGFIQMNTFRSGTKILLGDFGFNMFELIYCL